VRKQIAYDIEKLAGSGKFDTTIISRFFYYIQEYFDALTDFVTTQQRCLSSYTPVFVVNSDDERRNFLVDCFRARATIMKLGFPALLEELSVLEHAANVRNLKKFSDGQINFEATMKIYMDIIKSARLPKTHQLPDKMTVSQALGQTKSKPTIMLVEPCDQEMFFVSELLQQHFQLIACPEGQTAMSCLQLSSPELFLLNVQLPGGMSGCELAFMIRSMEQFAKSPIWFIADFHIYDPVKTCMPPNITRYISKPMHRENLLGMIMRELN